jgi:hypothetical protein
MEHTQLAREPVNNNAILALTNHGDNLHPEANLR